jgi:LmbE family N-acetylglucosaminyl deacetylase
MALATFENGRTNFSRSAAAGAFMLGRYLWSEGRRAAMTLKSLRFCLRGKIPAAVLGAITLSAIAASAQIAADPYRSNDLPPDDRFKADILVVVAHPDDEVMAAAYLARAIFDQGKRVAVVYQTPGDGGNNAIGAEQAAAMGDIRQLEARRAVGTLGIQNVFFLGGHDTASQNVLSSLAHCDHGRCLDELVRIVRITRPEVILTWLPDFATGENHADHQSSGVLATEAFDLAGDPTAFPEQVSPVLNPDKNMNLTEGLRPWQAKKIYYFYNPTHDFFAGQGPQYSVTDISPAKHESYGDLAAKEFAQHRTQGGDQISAAIQNHTLHQERGEIGGIVNNPVKFILGKSHVPGGVTDDVFAGVTAEAIAYQRAPGYIPATIARPTLRIGDPWAFYQSFWKAHGIDHLAGLVPLEITVHTDETLSIPLIIDNPTANPIDVTVSASVPAGWQLRAVEPARVPAHGTYFLRVQAKAPSSKLEGWQNFKVTARSGDLELGTVALRAELSTGWVAPQ